MNEENPLIDVWVTKYATTRGILQVQGRIFAISETMLVTNPTDNYWRVYYHKPFWHTSEKEAVEHAISIVSKKIGSLAKQQTKLKVSLVDLNKRLLDLC